MKILILLSFLLMLGCHQQPVIVQVPESQPVNVETRVENRIETEQTQVGNPVLRRAPIVVQPSVVVNPRPVIVAPCPPSVVVMPPRPPAVIVAPPCPPTVVVTPSRSVERSRSVEITRERSSEQGESSRMRERSRISERSRSVE